MSRIIVKNLPKEITEDELKKHFSVKGEVTDIKIMRKENGESRKFAFIGYKSEDQSQNIIKYFDNTYIKTCKIKVEEAKVQGDPTLNKGNTKKKVKGKEENTEEDSNVNDNSKEGKIKKLLELAKQMSNKSKFDAVQQKMREDQEKTEKVDDNTNDKENKNAEMDDRTSENKLVNESIKFDPKRLYLRNLSFEVTEEILRSKFEKYGDVTELHIPKNFKTNQSFGYAYIAYATVESAIMALSEIDKTIFQGRILHITPAQVKEEKLITKMSLAKEREARNDKSSFKKEKREKMKINFDNESNWNYLFINQNAVVEAVSKKLNIPKSEIMSRDNANLAVQVAAMETSIINETKEWFVSQGINLDVLKGKRNDCIRSKTTLLIKNISPNVNKEKLEEYFSRYGLLVRFILSPHNTMGVAEFVDKKHAENCMKKLAYFEIESLPLYLEYAPEGLMKKESLDEKIKSKTPITSSKNNEINLKENQGKILFITNLNFTTTEKKLSKFFAEKGFLSVNVKIIMHSKMIQIKNSPQALDLSNLKMKKKHRMQLKIYKEFYSKDIVLN
jgi:multiple RNA-binding domain-containing protein 1